jgi:HSP20 family protein
MPIIPWKPFDDLNKFFDDENWFFPVVVPHFQAPLPAMDIYETDKEVIAEVSLPDIDPEKIKISVRNGILRVSGSAEEKKEEKKKGYWKKEIKKGSFERSVQLPVPVKEENVDATYEKGMLKIVMPKIDAKEKEKKIKIKVKK